MCARDLGDVGPIGAELTVLSTPGSTLDYRDPPALDMEPVSAAQAHTSAQDAKIFTYIGIHLPFLWDLSWTGKHWRHR